ncbi:MAG: type III pantothenate kinase [Bacteroidota bacterium]
MVLAVDIGNTDIVLGIFDGKSWQNRYRHPSADFLSLEKSLRAYLQEMSARAEALEEIVFSSVVPEANAVVCEIIEKVTHQAPIVLGPASYHHFDLRLDEPQQLGTDLLANAVAAYAYFKEPCVAIDFGTALSFTMVGGKGEVLGVAIAPGLRTAMGALFSKTAQLYEVPLDWPDSVMGKNTEHALQAGILMGYTGLIKEMLARIQREMGQSVKVAATGGLAGVIPAVREMVDYLDPVLTLDGMRLIAAILRNSDSSKIA